MGWGMVSTNSVGRRVLVIIEDEPAIDLICTRTLMAESFAYDKTTSVKVDSSK
jgi:hypothetical protein